MIPESGGWTGGAIPLLYNVALLGVIYPHLLLALINKEVKYVAWSRGMSQNSLNFTNMNIDVNTSYNLNQSGWSSMQLIVASSLVQTIYVTPPKIKNLLPQILSD